MADDVDEEDESVVSVVELVPEGYPVLEVEDEAMHEVSAPLAIMNGDDTTATSVPYASTTYWPAVKLTLGQVHDAAAASTLIARVVPETARFLEIAPGVWGETLETRRNWSVSWGPE